MPKGSCLCQKLQYEYQGEPVVKARKVNIPKDKVHVISGFAKQFTQLHESGKKLTINFCGECGGTVYKTHESFPGSIIILAGTLDDPDGLEQSKPSQELFSKHRVSWLSGLSWAEQKQEF
ncbi:hypothetical protein N7462_010365 [Penicillium macrosclerotiorum]|uniref:uncharacterized protein n=1 Tax=Penicillium macrosclerotiorum TaxID=303699 RepID=UPI002549AB50|nr:uncharacterized protein N7462_010365 [Penicillium macrosclerotiorum]KAJ5669295.1 hypothetical protein N7462_010365 [Penicillium macrosclerotiorum]